MHNYVIEKVVKQGSPTPEDMFISEHLIPNAVMGKGN